MHDAERGIAVGESLHDDAEAEDVRQLLEADRLALHLAPDRIGALAPPLHHRDDAALGELLGELAFDLADEEAAALFETAEPCGDDLVGFRIEIAARQILELLAHLVHAL